VKTERVKNDGARNIIGFTRQNEAARARNTDHFVGDDAGIRDMDQDGLTRHQVKARIGEQYPFGNSDPIVEAVGNTVCTFFYCRSLYRR
jgi:hypothetical protein